MNSSICLVITELDAGGAEQCLVELALGLAERGWNVDVISLGCRPTAEKSALVERIEKASIGLHFLNASSWAQFFATWRQLRSLLKRQKPAIVQSFLFHGNVLTAISLTQSNRHVAGIRVAEPSRFRNRIERWALRKSNRVVCVSESVREHATRQRIATIDKLFVIPNGVAISNEPERPSAAPKEPYVSFVGRLHPQKGLVEALPVIFEILESDPKLHFVFVGDGPIREQLETQVAASSLCQRIHFAGWQPNARAWIRHSELLLLPSQWEGMPNVVLEAMAESTPVAATRVHGMSELLGPLTRHQCADLDQLAGLAIKLLSDAEKTGEIVQTNLERALSLFSWTAVNDAYEQMYKKVLEV